MSVAKPLYSSEGNITCDLSSLASDTNLLAGRASTAIDNSVTRFDDVMVSGRIAAHASVAPTANTTIEVWAYATRDATPNYVDGITGSDANKTMTSANIKASSLRLLWSTLVDAATGRSYDMPPTSVADRFGFMPEKWGVFVVHNTGQTLAASQTNVLKYRGINYESV